MIIKNQDWDWTLNHAEIGTPKEHKWLPNAIYNLFGPAGINAYCETLEAYRKEAQADIVYSLTKKDKY